MGTEPMGAGRRGQHRRLLAVAGVATLAVLAACTPAPESPSSTTSTSTSTSTTLATDPMPPVIETFTVRNSPTDAPALVTLGWKVWDPNGDALTCRLDADGDGIFESTYAPCPSDGLRNVEMPTAGAGTATLEVADADHPPVTAARSYSVVEGDPEPFDIELRGLDDLDPAVAAAFSEAVDRWELAIPGGVPDTTFGDPRPGCLPDDSPDLPETLDDLIIDVSTPAIDGVGGTLGMAGPSCIWSLSGRPFHGVMQFDAADVAVMLANGTLAEVIEHEIGHVLGIGTLWDLSWLSPYHRVLITGAGGSDPRYVGAAAVSEYRAMGASGDIPVENSGGGGTRDSHWREGTFNNELMTGWVNATPNPTSRMTIASMADMGFRVDLAGADTYSLPGGALLRRASGPVGEFERPPVGAL